jgi:hypothetical protein
VVGALLAGAGTAGTVVVTASNLHGGALRAHEARQLAESQVPRAHRAPRSHSAVRHVRSAVLLADAESARQLADRTVSWHVGGSHHSETRGGDRIRAGRSGADTHRARSRARGEASGGGHSTYVVAGPTGLPTGTAVAGTGSSARSHEGGPPSGVVPSSARISKPSTAASPGSDQGGETGGKGSSSGSGTGSPGAGGQGGNSSGNGPVAPPTGVGSGTGAPPGSSSVSTGTDGTNGGVDGGANSGGGRSTG